jgi:hypothetical protein
VILVIPGVEGGTVEKEDLLFDLEAQDIDAKLLLFGSERGFLLELCNRCHINPSVLDLVALIDLLDSTVAYADAVPET